MYNSMSGMSIPDTIMLMQPSQTPSTNQFDFILNKPQPQPQKLGGLTNLSKPMAALIGAVVVLIIVVLASLLLKGGGSGGSQQMLVAAQQATEISRVSGIVIQQPASDDTKALAATTQTTLASEINDLTSYLESHGTKVDAKKLSALQNNDTDNQIQLAAQNNNLDSAYSSFLKQQLGEYVDSLSAAYKSASPQAKQILNSAYSSVQVLSQAPQLSSSR